MNKTSLRAGISKCGNLSKIFDQEIAALEERSASSAFDLLTMTLGISSSNRPAL